MLLYSQGVQLNWEVINLARSEKFKWGESLSSERVGMFKFPVEWAPADVAV